MSHVLGNVIFLELNLLLAGLPQKEPSSVGCWEKQQALVEMGMGMQPTAGLCRATARATTLVACARAGEPVTRHAETVFFQCSFPLFLWGGNFLSAPRITASHCTDLALQVLRVCEPHSYCLFAGDCGYALAVAVQWWCSWETSDLRACSQCGNELEKCRKSGYNPEAAAKSSRWSLRYVWHSSCSSVCARTGVTKSRLQHSLARLWVTQVPAGSQEQQAVLRETESLQPVTRIRCSVIPGHLFTNPVSQLPLASCFICSAPVVWHIHTIFSYNPISRGGKRGCLGWQWTCVHPYKDPPVLSQASVPTGMVVAFL